MHIDGTRVTPYINIEKGKIEIKGRSIPEDALEFYTPIVNSIQEYFNSAEGNTEIVFHLEYINSGSKKFITNMLVVINDYYKSGKSITAEWFYDSDDDSMLELGSDLKAMVQLPFNLHQVS